VVDSILKIEDRTKSKRDSILEIKKIKKQKDSLLNLKKKLVKEPITTADRRAKKSIRRNSFLVK
jgi:hypothetical protein